MGRKAKLPDAVWEVIGKRYLHDESARALGREFGVTEAAIRKRFSTQNKTIKTLANQILTTEEEFYKLPISTQIKVRTLADELISVSNSLASAARCSAATAHRTAAIANSHSEYLDESADLAENMVHLKTISAFTQVSNEAAKIGLNLLAANKDMSAEAFKDAQDREEREKQILPVDPTEASMAYQRMINSK